MVQALIGQEGGEVTDLSNKENTSVKQKNIRPIIER